jgi:hypothetical protein
MIYFIAFILLGLVGYIIQHNLFKEISMKTAQDIYFDLIKRVRAKVKSEERVVYDPNTGIQKTFLQGKLLYVKKFIPNQYRTKELDSNNPNKD